MIQNNKTLNGVSAITLALFVSPFTVSAGTAGYPQLHYYESTGNTVYASAQARTSVDIYAEKLSAIMGAYGLEKRQIATLLSVSRPTLDSWINKTVDKIRPDNMARIDWVEGLLHDHIPEELRAGLGSFLKRALEDESVMLISMLSKAHLEDEDPRQVFEVVNRRLSGIRKSGELDDLLGENRPAFI